MSDVRDKKTEEDVKADEFALFQDRLAACEKALHDEQTKNKRLQAEALYMQTAISKYVPPASHLHPSATICRGKAHTDLPESAERTGDDMINVSREDYELLQLKDRAMDSIKEGITIADCSLPDMPLIYANQGFVEITGCPVADVLGKNCRFLQGTGTEEESVNELRKAVALGKAAQVTLTNYRRNGDPFVNYLSITPVHNDRGQLTHYVGVQSDITELVNHKKAELAAKHQAVQAAAATEAKSQFLARMSHEIRTPLNGMIAVGQLLAETNLTASQRDLVNTIRCSGETLLILITDILDFSRIEANKMVLSLHHFKLRSVVEAAMEIAGLSAAQKRLQVAYHIAEDVPENLLGDSQRLQQILLNVLNNAVKFTEKGEVLLEAWMGSTEESLLEDTGYPIQAVKGILDNQVSADCLTETMDSMDSHETPGDFQKSFNRRKQLAQANGKVASPLPGSNQGLKPKTNPVDTSQAEASPSPADTDSERSAMDVLSTACKEQGTGKDPGGQDGTDHTACGRPLSLNTVAPRLTHTIHFAVRDTGMGISQDNLGRLFQLFSQVDSSRTRQHGGSGLGLAICKRLVEAMGGCMWATSPGKKQGSTFRFSIRCPMDTTAESDTSYATSSTSEGDEASGTENASLIRQFREDNADEETASLKLQDSKSEANAMDSERQQQQQQEQPGQPPTPFFGAATQLPELPDPSNGHGHRNQEPLLKSFQKPPKPNKKKDIRELRQVLSDILPGGSVSPSISERTSTDSRARSDESNKHASNINGSVGNDVSQQRSTDVAAEPSGIVDAYATPLLAAETSEDNDTFDQYGLAADPVHSQRDYLTHHQVAAGLSPFKTLSGKKVLLVEPNNLVRHCLILYLKKLGLDVRAVCSEDQAISCLRLQGALTRKASSEQLQLQEASGDIGSLKLEHAANLSELESSTQGPFDVVVTDIAQSSVLHALIQAAPSEAQRLVFMSWPGEHDIDKDLAFPNPSSLVDPRSLFPLQQGAGRPQAQPPKVQKEDMRHRTTTRQLGYVTVFRPIRPERLKLAIEEVLRTALDPTSAEAGPLMEVKSSSQLTSMGSVEVESCRHASSHELKYSANSSSSSSLQSHITAPGHLRVLLAEDNIINLKVALGILQRIGFKEVVCAADGVNALSEMTVRGGGESFDIVLTDLHMPRKGGMELVKDIRETWPESNVKVVAVTADAFDDTRDLCLSAGFDAWLAKPFRIQDLARVIDIVLSVRSPFKSPA